MMVRNVTMDGGFLAMLLWTIFFFCKSWVRARNPAPDVHSSMPGEGPEGSVDHATMDAFFFANSGLHPNDHYG